MTSHRPALTSHRPGMTSHRSAFTSHRSATSSWDQQVLAEVFSRVDNYMQRKYWVLDFFPQAVVTCSSETCLFFYIGLHCRCESACDVPYCNSAELMWFLREGESSLAGRLAVLVYQGAPALRLHRPAAVFMIVFYDRKCFMIVWNPPKPSALWTVREPQPAGRGVQRQALPKVEVPHIL